MTEVNEQWLIAGKLLTIGICAWLYSRGGMSMKWLRRWVAPILAAGVAYWISRSLWSLVLLALIPTLSMGYGADSFKEKVHRRLLWGSLNGLVGAVYLYFATGSFIPAVFQVVLVTSASVTFGVWNPFSKVRNSGARMEESAIGLAVFALPILAS